MTQSAITSTTAGLRDAFPALARTHAGQPVAYFDGPGGTQVPRAVAEAMTDYLYHHNANTHWEYPTSNETDEMIDRARHTMADFLNADAADISFGANMTTITFHIARALARDWKAGDELIVTELDHRANVDPWLAVASERGLVVRMVKADTAHGTLDWDDLKAQLSPRTKLLAIGAASNALGTISDVAAATALAHEVGALSFVDAVHYAPHNLVDVQAIDCDFLACSAYKFYGPHIGALYGRRELVEQMDVPKLVPSPDNAPDRLETGTQNHEGIAGAAAAVDFLASTGVGANRRGQLESAFSTLHSRGHALLEQLWSGLQSIDAVTLYGPSPDKPRTPTLSFTVRGVTSEQVARKLVRRGIFVSNGDFYASTIVERLGQAADGLVRAGCACYTTEDEVARLVEGVRELA